MTTLRKAAQQALEACTDAVMGWQSLAPLSVRSAAMESLDALRDALAQEDEMREMLRTLGFDSQCPESIGITLRRWRDGYAAALAQPEQEPVAWQWLDTGHFRKLYTHPPRREWQSLSEEEIRAAYGKDLKYRDGDYERFARAIEAALKEKNNG